MREGWREYKLGAATVLITDGSHYSPPTTEVGIPYVTVRDIKDGQIDLDNASRISPTSFDDLEKNGCRPLYKDVLFSKDGTVGKVAFVSTHEAFVVLSSLAILRANEDLLLPKFLAITLSAPDFQREASSSKTGLAIKRVVLKVLKTMAIRVPPLPEQKRIVDLISTVDSYIEALQRQLESAKRSRNAVLHELLTAGGDGWVETTLGDVADVVGGGTPSTSVPEYWDGDIVWLTPTEVTSQDGKMVRDSTRKITAAGLRSSGAQLLPTGSVVLTSRASVGYAAIAGTELCTNQGFQSLVPRESVLAEFLLFWVQRNRSEFESRSAGSTFKEISKSNVKSIKLSLPPLTEQKRIVDLVSTVDSFIDALEGQISSSTSLRSGLLSDLLSGDHEIPASYDQLIGAA